MYGEHTQCRGLSGDSQTPEEKRPPSRHKSSGRKMRERRPLRRQGRAQQDFGNPAGPRRRPCDRRSKAKSTDTFRAAASDSGQTHSASPLARPQGKGVSVPRRQQQNRAAVDRGGRVKRSQACSPLRLRSGQAGTVRRGGCPYDRELKAKSTDRSVCATKATADPAFAKAPAGRPSSRRFVRDAQTARRDSGSSPEPETRAESDSARWPLEKCCFVCLNGDQMLSARKNVIFTLFCDEKVTKNTTTLRILVPRFRAHSCALCAPAGIRRTQRDVSRVPG
jgi:hypothetical protein